MKSHAGANFWKMFYKLPLNDEYRVLGYRKGEEMRWIWIGNHNDYMRLIPER